MSKTKKNSRFDNIDWKPFVNPESIAIIGASPDSQKPNGAPLYWLLQYGFPGRIYPVNPKYEHIEGITCYPDLAKIPAPIELAIVAVPAADVLNVLQQCAQKKVKGAVIFTSGFAEAGRKGVELQEKIYRLARKSGLRMVGPNCAGVINLSQKLWASFAFPFPMEKNFFPHKFDFISQSGFFGTLIGRMAAKEGLFVDKFFSVGNEADLSLPHFLRFLAAGKDHEKSGIISCYIEGIKDREGPLFQSAVEKAIQNKKIITAIKVGQTAAGTRAAASHTAALTGTDQVYDSFFRQKGILRVPGPEQLLPLLKILAAGRRPKSRKTAIISDSGGGAVLLADKCQLYGLEVAEFMPETRKKMGEILPFFASHQNPVDITGQILTDRSMAYKCISTAEQDPNIEILILNFNISSRGGNIITNGIKKLYRHSKKPMIAIFSPFGDEQIAKQYIREVKECGIPVFEEMNNCIWALGALAGRMMKMKRYEKPLLAVPGLEQKKAQLLWEDYHRAAAKKYGSKTNSGEEKALLPMSEYQMKKILSCYDIPVGTEKLVYSEQEALDSAAQIGFPLVLKVVSPAIAHKTEIGGVILNINSAAAVKKAFRSLKEHLDVIKPGSPAEGLLVQKMLFPTLELIVGMKRDPVFGPVIICGLGGIFVEVLNDISMRVAPLSRQDAVEMLQELQGYKMLGGIRGREAADQEAIVATLLKVSRLALEVHALKELDINPLMVYPRGQGVVIADALGYWKI